MRRLAYLPDRAKLASLVAAAVGTPSQPFASVMTVPGAVQSHLSARVAKESSIIDSVVEQIQVPATGSVESKLQRFVENVRDRLGAQAVFVADSEGLELAYVGAEPGLIALLGEFTAVRRRVAHVVSDRRPLAMSVAVSESQWLQVFWLDEDASSPAIALVHRTLLSSHAATKLRHIVQSILGTIR
jgi:hypothetical protein